MDTIIVLLSVFIGLEALGLLANLVSTYCNVKNTRATDVIVSCNQQSLSLHKKNVFLLSELGATYASKVSLHKVYNAQKVKNKELADNVQMIYGLLKGAAEGKILPEDLIKKIVATGILPEDSTEDKDAVL